MIFHNVMAMVIKSPELFFVLLRTSHCGYFWAYHKNMPFSFPFFQQFQGSIVIPVPIIQSIQKLRILTECSYVKSRTFSRFTLYENAQMDPAGIPPLVAKYRRQLQFKPDKSPKFLFAPVGDIIQALTVFVKELAELVVEEG